MQLTVKGKDIVRALKVTKAIKAASMCLTYYSNELYVTVMSGVLYQKKIATVNVIDGVSMANTILFTDVSEFIEADSTVRLEFIGEDIRLSTNIFKTLMKQSNSLISKADITEPENTEKFNDTSFNRAVATIGNLAALEKMYKKTAPINFLKRYADVQYPTFWVRVQQDSIIGTLSATDAKLIRTFNPKRYCIDNDNLVLYTDTEVLRMPISTATDDMQFTDILQDMTLVATQNTTGMLEVLERANRTFGNGEVTAYIKECSFGVELLRADASTDFSFGTVDVLKPILCSFNIYLEFLILAIKLLGEGVFEILYKEGVLCLRNQTVSMLISVR